MTKPKIKQRFDGFLPIVIDVETAGVDPKKDALLEVAAFLVDYDEQGLLQVGDKYFCHVEPFKNANLDPRALEFTGIDPFHPFRFAIPEQQAIKELFEFTRKAVKAADCRRAVLVGHNAHFDLSFIKAAYQRTEKQVGKNPYHRFTCFDTATLGGLAYGKTVLAKALKVANIPFNKREAHSAIYDAQQTAILFCQIINLFPFAFTNLTDETENANEEFEPQSN